MSEFSWSGVLNLTALGHMTVKEKILNAVEQLPSETTFEEAMDRLFLLYKVEKGLSQVSKGQTLTQEEAKRRMRQWLR